MARRKTREELERDAYSLHEYQEAFHCLMMGEKPTIVESGEGDDRIVVRLLGVSRHSGGIVIHGDSSSATPVYACDWCVYAESSPACSPYARDVAAQIRRLQKAAVEARYEKSEKV